MIIDESSVKMYHCICVNIMVTATLLHSKGQSPILHQGTSVTDYKNYFMFH